MLKHGCFTSPFLISLLVLSVLSCKSPKAQIEEVPNPSVSEKLRPRSSTQPSRVVQLYFEEDPKSFSKLDFHKLESYLLSLKGDYLPCIQKYESIHRSIAVRLELNIKDKGLFLNRFIQKPKDPDLEKCLRKAFLQVKHSSPWIGKSVNLAFIAAQSPESLPWWAGSSWSKAIALTLEKEDSKLRFEVLE